MIKYSELVQYIKNNHVDWNIDLFDVLRGFFKEYSHHPTIPSSPVQSWEETVLLTPTEKKFKEPEGGEYTIQDLFDLFSA